MSDHLEHPSRAFVHGDLSGQIVKLEANPFAQGQYCDLWMGIWKKQGTDKALIAVKVPRGLLADTELADGHKRRFLKEVKTLSALDHPNIAPLFGISFDFYQGYRPCLVSPFYCQGDAAQYLQSHPHVNKLPLITQVAGAISYLHTRPSPIFHGDIKACNILIGDNNQAVLSDFGLARIFSASGFTTMTAAGSWRWMAPELNPRCEDADGDCIRRTTAATDAWSSVQVTTTEAWRWKAPEQITTCSNEDKYIPITAATDVWSFAMTVVEIFTGHIPFSHIRNDGTVVLAIASGMTPKRERHFQISDEVWAMLERCWDFDPNQRPSMITAAHFFELQSTSPYTSLV